MIRATPHSRIRLNGVVFQSTVTTVPFLYIQKIQDKTAFEIRVVRSESHEKHRFVEGRLR